MNNLVLLRHGQSDWNLQNRFTGWKNIGLSKKGILEAKESGRLIKEKNIKIDRVYSSVLKRANDTATITFHLRISAWGETDTVLETALNAFVGCS